MVGFTVAVDKLRKYVDKQPGTVVMQARVPGEVSDTIDMFCKSSGVSRSQVVREALVSWMQTMSERAVSVE